MGADHRAAALAVALLSPLRSIVAPFFSSATELLGGDPGRLRPFAGSRKLAVVGADGIGHAAHIDPTRIVALVRSRIVRPDRLERLIPVGVCALLVAAAALSSLPPVGTAAGGAAPTYGTRVVIGGLDGNTGSTTDGTGSTGSTGSTTGTDGTTAAIAPASVDGPVASGLDYYPSDVMIPNTLAGPEVGSAGQGVFSTYVVAAGDTLGAIAARFDISQTTLYWANNKSLPDPASIRIGQRLIIPPVDGLVVVVSPNDTIDSLATKYSVDSQEIVDANNLSGPNIVTGETLLIPGASGGPMPAAKIPAGGGSSSSWTGGRLLWPVLGGSSISQYFHTGHPAIDIAAHMGQPVVAAAAGTVIYAGWKTTGGGIGGGIVVWISHNGKLYTTYNHLSSEIVRIGQHVSAGQRIGSIGMTGNATGPHLHFEVWVTLPWGDWTTSGARNPMLYVRRG
jgi:murein DD-endopeptidase MepM/ murein hydrolase activator NlpD